MESKDNGAADPAHRCFHQGDVLGRCVEAILRCNTLIPFRLKGNDQFAEARAIGPESVTENDAWLCLRHFALLYCQSFFVQWNWTSKMYTTISFAKNTA